jgi:plastocyanin
MRAPRGPRSRATDRPRRGALVAVVGIMSLLLVGPAALASGAKKGSSPTRTGILFGASVAIEPGGLKWTSQRDFESMVGRTMAIDKEGYAWDDVWPSAYEYWSRDQGRVFLFEWNAQNHGGSAISWAAIASGNYDATIDARASAIKAFKAPAYFVFHHEPEDQVGDAGTQQDFVNAYRHVHDRFAADGVTNLKYALVLLASTYRYGDPDAYYPGDQYVDLVGADGYNWYGCPGRTDPWTSFSDVFSDFRDYGNAKGKRLLIAEWGSTEDSAVPGRKADWITDAGQTLKSWPEMEAIAYYHNGPPASQCDWRVDTSQSALDAFTAMGADAQFNPTTLRVKSSKAGYIAVDDFTFSNIVGSLERGKSVQWIFQGPNNHTATDNSGMGLFDSGSMGPDTTFGFQFRSAANYRITCSIHPSMTAVIRVPMVVDPSSGGVSTQFTATWAARAPWTGYVYDVQVKRPGSSSWTDLWKGTTALSGSFVPDSGKGTYTFRSRVRNSSTGAATWYSEEFQITVN